MAWFRYLKTPSSTSFSYPFTKRTLTRFTPLDDVAIDTWIAIDITDLGIGTYFDANLVEQMDASSYLVVYEDVIGDDILNSLPCSTVIDGDTLYFKTPVVHEKDKQIDRIYSVYYNTPNLRYIKKYDDTSYVIDSFLKPFAADISNVDRTSVEVTLGSSSYYSFSFINPIDDWDSGLASKSGAKAYLTFTGPNFDLRGIKGPTGGKARIKITSYANTGTPYTTVPVDWTVIDFYSRQEESNALLYSTTALPDSVASLELEVLADKNTLSGGYDVRLTSYEFSPSFNIDISAELIYSAAPYSTVNPYGSGSQFFAGSGVYGETIGPTGPEGPPGEEGHLITQDTPPLNPVDGQQWLDTSSGRQYASYNGTWFEVGAAFQGPAGPAGNTYKNAVINGGMNVWQRGAGAFTTNLDYTADRWQAQSSGSTFSISRQSFTPGELTGNESPYYMRAVATSVAGSANFINLTNRIEDVRTFAGQTVVVSFWAKATTSAKKVGLEIAQNFGTGGSTSVLGIGAQTFNLTTSWQRFSSVLNIPSISGKTVGTSSCLAVIFWLDAGSTLGSRSGSVGQQSLTFDLWGVQIEPGSILSSFDARLYAAELSLCQRYYYRVTSTGGYSPFGMGLCYLTTSAIGLVSFPVTMRIAPSAVETSGVATDYAAWGTAGAIVACNSIPTISLQGNSGCMVAFSFASGLTAGQATGLYSNNTANAYLGFSAEYS